MRAARHRLHAFGRLPQHRRLGVVDDGPQGDASDESPRRASRRAPGGRARSSIAFSSQISGRRTGMVPRRVASPARQVARALGRERRGLVIAVLGGVTQVFPVRPSSMLRNRNPGSMPACARAVTDVFSLGAAGVRGRGAGRWRGG